jgi:hypothetical protein
MKTTIKFFILFGVLNTFSWISPQKASAQVSVDFQVFYDDLSPYGNWINNDDYGYVWVPDVRSGFSPYNTDGHWVYTDAGWTWFSDYSWGWAPFHYGRWFYDRYNGWLWVPDTEWGPGWVTWRRSNDYYGWAPIGPGVSFEMAYGNGYNLPYNQWTFVNNRDFGRTNINNYYINNSNNITIINNTTIINNPRVDNNRHTRYNAGPDRNEAERHAGKTFAPVALRESNQPGQHLSNGELQLYRPRVEKSSNAIRKPAPAKVANLEDVKSSRQRNNNGQPQNEIKANREQPNKQQVQKNNDQPVKQPVQKYNEQPVRMPQQKNNEQPVMQPVQKNNEQPVRQPVQKNNEQPVRQPIQKSNEQPARQPVQKNNEQPVRQPIQKSNEQPAKQPVQKNNDRPTKQKNG